MAPRFPPKNIFRIGQLINYIKIKKVRYATVVLLLRTVSILRCASAIPPSEHLRTKRQVIVRERRVEDRGRRYKDRKK